MKKSIKVKYLVFLSVCFVFFIAFIIMLFKYSYSIYTDSKNWNYNTSSDSMYLSSNFLKEDDDVYFNMLDYDKNNVPFSVYNYESDTQISSFDIKYDISCSVTNGYVCKIDGNSNGVQDIDLIHSYTCSDSSLSEEQCMNSSSARLSYNKVVNNHTISIAQNSTTSSGEAEAIVTLTTKKPYKKVLTGKLKVKFSQNQGLHIYAVESSSSQCRYAITNYSDNYREYVFRTNDSNVIFKINSSTTYRIYLSRYSRFFIEVYKKNSNLSCLDAISVDP